MTKVWIVGRKGMLAQAFARLLATLKVDYFATSSCEIDIADPVAVESQSRPFTHLINCAAYTAVDRAEEEVKEAFALNKEALYFLAKRARREKAKIIHFSTDYVFDGSSKSPYKEDDRPCPLSVYGKSKLAGERVLLEEAPESLIIRSSWIFGPGPQNFVKTMRRLMNEREELSVVSDQWGRPTYVADLAEAAWGLREKEGIYHFAGEGETTWHGFASAILSSLQERKCHTLHPLTSDQYPLRAKRPPYSILSTDKIEKELRCRIRPWSEGLHEYLQQI